MSLTDLLNQAETIGQPQKRLERFEQLQDDIWACNKPYASATDLSTNLIAYVESITSETVGVIHSRPLLSKFVARLHECDNADVKIEVATRVIDLLAPKVVSYEQQDTDLKFELADAYDTQEDFISSAKTLQSINLDSSQRTVSDDEKAKVWMRICRCYLEEDDPTDALTYLNKIKNVYHNVTDHPTRLQFQLSQARISDSQRNFLDASSSYLALSLEPLIDEDERLQALSAAVTCAVLAPAGPARARQLGRLYKDERSTATPEHAILEKIFLDRLLRPDEVAAFAAGLRDHQLARTADGSTVLDRAVLEHNLLAVSRLYANIEFERLGALLGVDADRAEVYAAAMVESARLNGRIDQIEGVIYFDRRDGGGGDVAARDLRAWDSNVQGLAEEVEKVTTMLQRHEPVWYEEQVRA